VAGRKIKLTLQFLFFSVLISTSIVAAAQEGDADWRPSAFEINDTDGQQFSFPADLEKPTVVLFWATWCPFCKAFMPHLQSMLDEYGDQVDVLALHIWDEEDPAAFLGNYGFQFRLLPSADDVADSWGVKGTPGIFLVDSKGELVFSRGAIPREAYRLSKQEQDDLKRPQIAARVAPLWAARLRMALDKLVIQ